MRTEIWDGYPEPSNAPYGLAKKMLLVLSDAYRRQYGLSSCAPVLINLYGPGDDFDPEDSHVVAAIVRRFVEAERERAPEVVLWGSGEPTREFLYVDDAARAMVLAAERYDVIRAGQHRHRAGGQDARPRRADRVDRGLRGGNGLGRRAPRRPAAQVLDVRRAPVS